MSGFADKILAQLQVKFNLSLLNEIKFFDTPLSLQALNSAIVAVFEKMRSELESKLRGLVDFDIDDIKSLKNFIKSDPDLNNLLAKGSDELNDNILSSLLLQCEILNDPTITDESVKQKAIEKLSAVDFLGDSLDKLLDFIGDLANKLANLAAALAPYLGMALFLYYILKLAIDLLTNTRFPSPYRMKYIQKLIRMALDFMKDVVDNTVDQIKSIFSGIDKLLITIAAATALYLFNRIQLQKQSTEQLAENLCEDLGLNPFEDIDIQVNTNPLNIDAAALVCDPVITDTVIVPKEPFENKEDNFSCEVPTEEGIEEIVAILKEDLATKAIIVNERDYPLIPEVTVGSQVTDRTVIATIGNLPVYSPVNGYITSLDASSITLRDISDSTESYLTSTINELNQKYTEQNEIKMFLKDWEVVSLYPVMMARSPVVDTSIRLTGIEDIGMYDKFNTFKKFWNDIILKSYDKNMTNITREENIKPHAENNTLEQVKIAIDEEEEKVNKYLRSIEQNAINQARNTLPKPDEFILSEYYLVELAEPLNAVKNSSGLTAEYRTQINEFTSQRLVIDGYKPEKIDELGNDYIKELEKGISLGNKWFQKGIEKYNESKKLSDVENWLKELAKENKKLEETEKEEFIAKIMFMYDLYINFASITEKYKDLKESSDKTQIIKEGNYISNFFGQLWIRYDALPGEIKELEKRIESLALFTTYSIKDVEGEEYRNYLIPSGKDRCPRPAIDPNLGGATETDFGSYKYWLKYCAMATLIGLNPATWSTGFILPTGPLLLPVIYIPITPITTPYGFIVLGLTICGIWIFPMILMTNYSSNYSLPIFDPTTITKNLVTSLKKTISEQLKNFKKSTLENYADKIAIDVEALNVEVAEIEDIITAHRLEKPPETKKFRGELIKWNTTNLELKEVKTETKLRRWAEEKKYKIVYEAATLGTSTGTKSTDAGLSKIQQTEDLILKQFDKLDILIDKIDKIIAPLPITLQPDTTTFGFTLKNPKPIINIASKIDDNINEGPLTKITERFKLNNEDLMTKVGAKFDYKKYTRVLKVAMPTLIKKDPFPAYENLSPINIPYLTFLAKDFTVKGSQTYGFPGMLPPPIG